MDVTSAGDVYLAYKQSNANTYIAKYSSAGISQGTTTYPGTGTIEIADILCDSNGNTYVAGNYSGTIEFGSTASTSSGNGCDFYIIRYGSDDNVNMRIFGNQNNANRSWRSGNASQRGRR